MTNAEAKEWIVKLISAMKEDTRGMWADPQYKDEVYEALDDAIKALGREEAVLNALEDVRAEIMENIETIIGKYDSNTKPENMPSRKIERNNGRAEAIDIINRKIKECKHET